MGRSSARRVGVVRMKLSAAFAALMLTAAFAAVSASSAAASGSSYFCPSDGNSMFLHGYSLAGDRCTQHYNTLTEVQAFNSFNYYVCADVKPNSDGSGGDLETVDCEYGTAVTGPFSSISAYATIINHQGAGHSGFQGIGFYSG